MYGCCVQGLFKECRVVNFCSTSHKVHSGLLEILVKVVMPLC